MGRWFTKVDPGAIVSAVALGVLSLLIAAESAKAFVPAVAVGTVRVLAPAMRTMLANATEGAVAMTGSAAVRATARQAANVGGMGAMVTVSRTASRDSMAKALAGLAAAAGIAGIVEEAADSVDCTFSVEGVRCDTPIPQGLVRVFCVNTGIWTGMHGGSTQANIEVCEASGSAAQARISSRLSAAGRSPSCSSTPAAGTSSWGVTCSYLVSPSSTTARGSQSWSATRSYDSSSCVEGTEASQLDPSRCRISNPASWDTAGAPAKLYERLKDRDGWLTPGVAQGIGQAGGNVPEAEAPTVVEEVEPQVIPLPGTRRTWQLPDGTEVVEEVLPEYVTDPEGDTITYRRVDRRTVTPTGAEIPNRAPDVEEGVVRPTVPGGTPSPAPLPTEPQEDLECGIPGYPKCQIDETGTPTGEDFSLQGYDASGLMVCISNPASCLPALPALSWDFSLPTGCAAIPIAGFGETLTTVDICEFQPMFHDLMSVVWVAGGLFGAIGLFWRKTLGGS